MNICLFSEDEISRPLDMNDPRAVHIIRILHKNEGDSFYAGIIGGKSGTAVINRITGVMEFSFTPEGDGKPLSPLRMIIGIPRPIQLKRLLRDIAALGVAEVHLTGTELGEKSYMQSTLLENNSTYKMLLDGTVQAASTHVPVLSVHRTLADCLESLERAEPPSGNGLRLLLDNVRPQIHLSDCVRNFADSSAGNPVITAAVGSERGWTDRERNFFAERGYISCGMGERVMRTETAATVAGAIILSGMNWL